MDLAVRETASALLYASQRTGFEFKGADSSRGVRRFDRKWRPVNMISHYVRSAVNISSANGWLRL